jgi:hypothetical protein
MFVGSKNNFLGIDDRYGSYAFCYHRAQRFMYIVFYIFPQLRTSLGKYDFIYCRDGSLNVQQIFDIAVRHIFRHIFQSIYDLLNKNITDWFVCPIFTI